MKRIPVHPVLLALFPVAYLFSINVNYSNLWELPRVVIATALLAMLAWGAAALLLRNRHKSALLATLLMVAFFTYGPLLDALRPLHLGRHVLVAPLELIALLNLFVLILRSKRDFAKATYPLNILGLCLLAVSLSSAAIHYDWSATPEGAKLETRHSKLETENLPNIYYIIPDAFGRSDILQHRYQCDDSAFLDALHQRGFYVAEQATSNYWMTLFSLSSSMTMDYHHDLAQRWKPDDAASQIATKRYLRAAVAEGPVISKLREAGYTIVSFSSGYSVSETVDADVYIGPPAQINEFEQGVIDMTPLRWALLRFQGFSPYQLHRERIEYLLDHIDEAARIPGPKFVLFHLAIPHPPFVFGPDGEDVSPRNKPFSHRHNAGPLPYGEVNQDFINKYRDQVTYTCKRLLQAVDTILEIEPHTPVILLQGDHGPMANRGKYAETYFPGERFPIFSAYLLPPPPEDKNPTGSATSQSQIANLKSKIAPYPSITPVNSFRLIFNRYFGDDYPLLPDHNIANTSGLGIMDVTQQVQEEAAEIVADLPMTPLENPGPPPMYYDEDDLEVR